MKENKYSDILLTFYYQLMFNTIKCIFIKVIPETS